MPTGSSASEQAAAPAGLHTSPTCAAASSSASCARRASAARPCRSAAAAALRSSVAWRLAWAAVISWMRWLCDTRACGGWGAQG